MFAARTLNSRCIAVVCVLTLAALLATADLARADSSVLSPSPTSWDFGNDDTHNGGGPTQTFTFTNNTGGNVNVATDNVVGTDASDFQQSSNTCPGAVLPPTASCSVLVTFNASSTGERRARLRSSTTRARSTFRCRARGSPASLVPAPTR